MNSENLERSAMEERLNKDLHALLLPTRNRLNQEDPKQALDDLYDKMMEALAEVTILI